jgi:hypothetical protein
MSTETFAYDNLIGGSQKPIVQRPGTVALGQTFARGGLAGLLASTGKWQACDFTDVANFSDFGIAVEAIDTTTGELPTTFYVEGEFNQNHVTIGYGDDYDDWRDTLAGHGIYLRDSVTTAGV